MKKYYKVLRDHCGPFSHYDFTNYLPDGKHEGGWLPKVKELEICGSGYHVTDKEHLRDWLCGNELYEIEVGGRHKTADDKEKSTWQEMRFVRKVDTWNDKTLRLFACWCVRQVWDLLTDDRSRNAVIVAEKYVNGEATKEELGIAHAAADAAYAAAYAAHAAAYAAADAADAAYAAYAADAARAAARDDQSAKLIEMLGLK